MKYDPGIIEKLEVQRRQLENAVDKVKLVVFLLTHLLFYFYIMKYSRYIEADINTT